MSLQPGTRLGPYEILTLIGAGGMGEVYKARDTRLGRLVAIKQLASAHADRFEPEARAIAALNHPHICQIHDVGPDYLVLEYVEGAPLRGPVPAADAVRWAIQMASALEEAHRFGVIHRDLKPANVLVTATGALKLLDFGLAKLVDADADVTRTAEGTVMGTAAYMAPEQAEGRPLDARADIFSFGAVLYELLSGLRAFPGDTIAQVLAAVLRADPAPLRTTPALQSLVRRCLERQPERRFQTMAEVRAALEHLGTASEAADRQPSIAVLPFANLSADPDNEYFSDGLAEEILNELAHVPGLKVIARTSAFAFKGKQEDIRRIAEVLGVTNVLEGSVRKAGSRIRVTAQLIVAADGSHLWSERYDRELADVFAIQDEIAQAIATALRVKLSLSRQHTPTIPAYEAYLKGQFYRSKPTPEFLALARQCYEQAITFDPGFALPHAALGSLLGVIAMFGILPAHTAMPLARAAGQAALHLDPALPEAHATLGEVAMGYDFDWREGHRRFQQAMARGPIPPTVRQSYAVNYLITCGRAGEAVEELERAIKEDPLNIYGHHMLLWALVQAERDADAVLQGRRILEFDDKYFAAYYILGLVYRTRGMLTEALAYAERASTIAPWDLVPAGLFGGLLKLAGDTKRADEQLQQIGNGQAYHAPLALTIFYLACSDIDQAAHWAKRAIEQRSSSIVHHLISPLGIALRASHHWPALSRMMNLPDTGT